MADAVFQNMVNTAGLSEQIMVDSAGTSGWHSGDTAHRGTLKVLRQKSVPYNGRSRQLTRHDLNEFDYILAMDSSIFSDIRRLGSSTATIKMFLSYANQAAATDITNVPDPYYDGRFDETFELVEKGCAALLNHITKTHDLN
jgi:protein-tyrosine phosphatase